MSMCAFFRSRLAWFCLAGFLLSIPVSAGPIVGAIATESGVPISGQEDIVIFNFTGPAQGCSTSAGTPICTSVTFDNVSLTINGSDTLNLGNLAPGMSETYSLPGGAFVDGSVLSLAFSATLSATSLTDDMGNTYAVNSSVSLTGLPVDGSFAAIAASPAVVGVPEPGSAALAGMSLAACGLWLRRRRRAAVENRGPAVN